MRMAEGASSGTSSAKTGTAGSSASRSNMDKTLFMSFNLPLIGMRRRGL